MVMADMPQPRETFVLIRGEYDKKGDKVTPGVPAVAAAAARRTRRPTGWAWPSGWSIPSHPLTARVTVNRYWQQYFGTGIVKTSEDFGAQGEWPTHPELLDWLATEFIAQRLGRQAMQRLIVTSATYRQSSQGHAGRACSAIRPTSCSPAARGSGSMPK